jgi:hypothetical protein
MTWRDREAQAAADLGMTREQYRVLLITRVWPYWLIGNGPKVRKLLFERQKGVCPLGGDILEGPRGDVDHLRPKKEFVSDDLPILDAIKACWDIANLRLVHPPCHRERTNEQRGPFLLEGE